MTKLSIITINFNNASGLKKTMQSVLSQTSNDFEYIVIDGGSTDGSKDIITNLAKKILHPYQWVCEADNGIYHAMNKGIRMAQGEYIQFVNSGDCLVNDHVTEKMLNALSTNAVILYGNMLKQMPNSILRDKSFAGRQPTMLDFYRGTLNHSSAYIKRSLFEKYGLYDENLMIVSDWKWFLQSIVLSGEHIDYYDVDVTLFDMTGISSVNKELTQAERLKVLKELLPVKLLLDYQTWSHSIFQIQRIKRYKWSDKLFYLIDRLLFKWEKN